MPRERESGTGIRRRGAVTECIVFRPPPTVIKGLDWRPVGPGKDSFVMLEAFLRIGASPFRLMAFRVPMPRAAGWSSSPFWEDDKRLHDDGLLWDVDKFKAFVERIDASSCDESDNVLRQQGTDHGLATAALASAWQRVRQALQWSRKEWQPTVINCQPYVILGYPASAGPANVPHIALDDTSLRTSNQSLEPTFQIEIEGAPCFLACSCLRSRGSTRFESLNAILPNLPGWEGAGVLEHDGRPHAALIIPADTCDFSLDEGTLCQSLARDIGSGTVRWFFGIPMDHIDDDGMTMLEALSDVVRRRRLVASRGGLWMTGNIRDTMSMLKVPKRVLREGSPRSLLYDVLGRARIYGVTLNENGSPTVLRERVLDSLFVTVENAYIGISDAFAFISDNTDPGAITATRQGRSLETGLSGRKLKDVIVAPAWKKELPVLLDRPIREAVLSLATG